MTYLFNPHVASSVAVQGFLVVDYEEYSSAEIIFRNSKNTLLTHEIFLCSEVALPHLYSERYE